jgi:FixJ family two-component response regulator
VVAIDDDPGFRESLGLLLQSARLRSRLFASIAECVATLPQSFHT